MSENMMCKDHKASTDKYRENYDRVFGRDGKDNKQEGEKK